MTAGTRDRGGGRLVLTARHIVGTQGKSSGHRGNYCRDENAKGNGEMLHISESQEAALRCRRNQGE